MLRIRSTKEAYILPDKKKNQAYKYSPVTLSDTKLDRDAETEGGEPEKEEIKSRRVGGSSESFGHLDLGLSSSL